MTSIRPHYGKTLDHDRIMNIFFYTSNAIKLLQARLLFMRHGYLLNHFKGVREPYDESYELGTSELLHRAIHQVNTEFGVRSIFFVEDTSVRIEALSDSKDFPGLAVKEWFSTTSFEQLDVKLNERGSDRRATIYSDIALYMPTLQHPIFFHGETSGTIAAIPPSFDGSIQYPWLTPTTFNGWFIPNGATKRLGEMEFEESLDFDFRAKAIKSLLARLEELNAALNLRPNFYTVRKPGFAQGQLSLMPEESQLVLAVVGDKCAGKTTFSDHMASYESVRVFEASTVLRGLAEEDGVSISNADEALIYLAAKDWSPVAARIADYIEKSESRWNVVTGLRTPEELLALKQRFPETQIILIDTDARIRFERHIKRARDADIKTFPAFQAQDEMQRRFGILRAPNEIADFTINNDGSIEQYQNKIDDTLDEITKATSGRPKKTKQLSELHRCLTALYSLGGPASCEKISEETGKLGAPVRVYNTNRALKEVPEFANRLQNSDAVLQYEITKRGQLFLYLLELLRGPMQPVLELPFS